MKFLILLALIPYCCYGKSVLIDGQLAHPADCTKHGEKLFIAAPPPPPPAVPAELLKSELKTGVLLPREILEDPLKKKDESNSKPANGTEKVTMTVTKVTRGAPAADKLEVVGKITPAMQELVNQTDALLKNSTLEASPGNKTAPVEISKNVNKTAAAEPKPEPGFLDTLASKLNFMARKKRSTGEIDTSKLKTEKISLTKDQFKASMLSDKAEAKESQRQERSYGGGSFVRDFDDDFSSTRSDFQYAVRTLPALRSGYDSSSVREFPEFDSSPAIRSSRYRRSPGYSSVRDFPEIRSGYGSGAVRDFPEIRSSGYSGSSFREAPLDFERSSYGRSLYGGQSDVREFPEIRSGYGGGSFREAAPLDLERSVVLDSSEGLRSSRYRRSADAYGGSSVRDFPEIRSGYGSSAVRDFPEIRSSGYSGSSFREAPLDFERSSYGRSLYGGSADVRDFPEIRSSYGSGSFREAAPLDLERSSSYGSLNRDFPEEVRSSRYRRSADAYGGSSVRDFDEVRSGGYGGSSVRELPEIRSSGYGSLVRDDSFERASHGYGKSLGYGSPALAVRELPEIRSSGYGSSAVRTLEEIPAIRVLDSEVLPLRSSGYGLQAVREIPAIRSEIIHEAPLLRSSYASKVPALRSSSYGGSSLRDLDFDDDVLDVKSSGKFLNDFSDLRVSHEFPVVRSSPIHVSSSLDVAEPLEVRGGGEY